MKYFSIFLGVFFSCSTIHVQAHRLWIFPHETIKAGNAGPDTWVTFDVAISDDIFHIDHAAPKLLEPISVLLPSGEQTVPQDYHNGKLRSTFDVNLSEEGTYKIFTASTGLQARWQTEDGKKGFWLERGSKGNPSELGKAIPANAKNVEITQSSRRVEALVTLGKPSTRAFTITNRGLEYFPITHPADFARGESAKLKFLMDGVPAAGAEITLVRGGSRYRQALEEQKFVADKDGIIEILWSEPGSYWLGASYKDSLAPAPAKQRSGSYSLSFEVFQ